MDSTGKDENNLKRYMHPNVQSSTVYNSQNMEATEMSMERGMDKEDVIHLYNGTLLSHKKEWHNAICSNMDEPTDYNTKWSKSYRESQMSYDLNYMWNLKNDTNELIYKREIDLQNRKKNRKPRGKGERER